MARSRHGSKTKSILGFLIYGNWGTGKSTMALSFTRLKREDGKPFRVMYIDSENGSIDDYIDNEVAEHGLEPDNLWIVETQSIKEIKEIIMAAAKGEPLYEFGEDGNPTGDIVLDADGEQFKPDAVVLDSTTVLYLADQMSKIEFSKKRAKVRNQGKGAENMSELAKSVKEEGAGLELKDYNTIRFDGVDLVRTLMRSGIHFDLLSLDKDDTITSKDKQGNAIQIATGKRITDGFKKLEAHVKTVIHTSEDEYGELQAEIESKDRTSVHKRGDILKDLTLEDWQEVIEKNKGRVAYNNVDGLSNSIKKDLQLTEEKDSELKSGDVEDLTREAMGYVKQLTAEQKKVLTPKLKEVGFTPNPKKLTTVEDLNKYIDIIKSVL